ALEAKKQFESIDIKPDIIAACIGGGSNFAGFAYPFISDKLRGKSDTEFVACEPKAVPSTTRGTYTDDFGDTAEMAPLLKVDTASWTSKHTKTFKQADLWTTNLPVFKSNPTYNERQFQDRVVQLISIERRPEDALELLSKHYRVDMPALRIGLPRGEKRALG